MLTILLALIATILLGILYLLYRIAANQIALNSYEAAQHNQMMLVLRDIKTNTKPSVSKGQ